MQPNRSDHRNSEAVEQLVALGAQGIQLVTQLIDPDLPNWILVLILLGNLLQMAKQKASPPQD